MLCTEHIVQYAQHPLDINTVIWRLPPPSTNQGSRHESLLFPKVAANLRVNKHGNTASNNGLYTALKMSTFPRKKDVLVWPFYPKTGSILANAATPTVSYSSWDRRTKQNSLEEKGAVFLTPAKWLVSKCRMYSTKYASTHQEGKYWMVWVSVCMKCIPVENLGIIFNEGLNPFSISSNYRGQTTGSLAT